MKHVPAETLVLLAYGELAPDQTADVEAHLAACERCHAELARLERARVALDWALRRGRRPARWAILALAAAAILAAVLLVARPSRPPEVAWRPLTVWSPTGGYVAGGEALVAIDSALTRLEQETFHAPQ